LKFAPHTPFKYSVDTRPLHIRVEEALEKLIKNCKPGDKLPSEAELAQQIGISRATLREALQTFAERGMIISKHGVGTFVANNWTQIESGLEVLESVDSMAERFGYKISVCDLNIQQQAADAVISEQLNINEGDPILVITRGRVKDGLILAYLYDAIPASLIDPEEFQTQFAGSVLDYLRSHLTSQPFWTQTNLHSLQATPDLAKKMNVPHGTALLLLEEKLFSVDNCVINFSRNYFLTSHFRFHIIRRSV
jgi:GntR family transcriptional regulator